MKRMCIFSAVLISYVLLTTNLYAQFANSPWLIRVRALTVQPDESSKVSVIGGRATVSGSTVPELDITYFFNKHVAAELILGVTNHNVNAVSTSVGDVPLGEVWLLPPTLSLQFHPFPNSVFSPYFGPGLNYTVFFGVDKGTVATAIDYKNSFGYSFQGGFDLNINEHWGWNFDVKKLFLQTDVNINALGASILADVNIDPWLIGSGFRYRF